MAPSPDLKPERRWAARPEAQSDHPNAVARRARELEQETEPYDHPWRQAQADAHQAEYLARVIQAGIRDLGEIDQRRMNFVNGADEELLNLIDECEIRISELFKLGLRLLLETGASHAEVSRAAELRGRQLQHLLSSKASDVLDPRMRRQFTPTFRLRAPNRNYARRLVSSLSLLHGKASDIAHSNPSGAFPRDREAQDFFFQLRSASENRDEVKLMLIGMLRDAGYSWRDVGDVMNVTAQGAYRQYGQRLKIAAEESATARPEEPLGGMYSCRYDAGFGNPALWSPPSQADQSADHPRSPP